MNVKNLVLGIGIFIVYLLMLNYGIEAFYKSPQYNDFCSGAEGRYSVKMYPGAVEQNCKFSKTLTDLESQCYADGGMPVFEYDSSGCATALKECDFCNKMFNDATIEHDKVVFVVAIIVGIITLFIGYLVLSTEPVGSALMASGVGAIFYGSMRNWQNLSNVWRFLLLVVALVLLVWIALRLNKNIKGKKK
jgi:hypothetical protein